MSGLYITENQLYELRQSVKSALEYTDRAIEYQKKLEQFIIELGGCPVCLTIPQMDREMPLSDCECGTGEDYAKRPTQKAQWYEMREKHNESICGQ